MENNEQLVVFKLGKEEYAIKIDQVREIINYIPVTKLPQAPSYLEGIINVRGKIIPVVDFAAKLGISGGEEIRTIVIVEIRGKDIGLTVDMVSEVLQASQENFSNVNSDQENLKEQWVYKLKDRIIIMLDVENVLN